jgi:hypothetical protein
MRIRAMPPTWDAQAAVSNMYVRFAVNEFGGAPRLLTGDIFFVAHGSSSSSSQKASWKALGTSTADFFKEIVDVPAVPPAVVKHIL